MEVGWEALVLGHFSQPLPSGLLASLFILACIPYPTSTCRFDFLGLILVPSAHTQNGWGWLLKLKSMTLSGAECSMAVIAAFPLSLVVVLSSVPFPINIDILGFSQNCSCTALALSFKGTLDMPRTELFSAMFQDYLDFYYTSSAIPLLDLGLGPQCKNGPGPQILGPHNNH